MLFGSEPADGQRGEEKRRGEEKWGGLMGSVCVRHSVGLMGKGRLKTGTKYRDRSPVYVVAGMRPDTRGPLNWHLPEQHVSCSRPAGGESRGLLPRHLTFPGFIGNILEGLIVKE